MGSILQKKGCFPKKTAFTNQFKNSCLMNDYCLGM